MISLNYRDSRPIYEQIRDGLRKLIVTGALSADEKLPSVRALAAQLAINPNTVQKAYRMLEQNGIIQTVPGKGSFLAGGDEAKRRQKARGVAALRAALQAALDSGLTGGEIRQECESYLEEKEGKRL